MNDLRSQLSPAWSGVNIALTVVLFVIAWPLGLLMVAYIVWGRQAGLDLSRPETLSAFGGRLRRAWQAATQSWRREVPLSTGRPADDVPGGRPSERVSGRTDTADRAPDTAAERETLERERQAFEAEKRDWNDQRQRHEPLDS